MALFEKTWKLLLQCDKRKFFGYVSFGLFAFLSTLFSTLLIKVYISESFEFAIWLLSSVYGTIYYIACKTGLKESVTDDWLELKPFVHYAIMASTFIASPILISRLSELYVNEQQQ